MKSARLGAVGARPNAFNTTRYSEKLLEAFGISVSCIDLSEVFGRAEKIGDQDQTSEGSFGKYSGLCPNQRHSISGDYQNGQAGNCPG